MSYDAVVLVSFGGPERPEDVMPFLQNVTRGRGVPPERLTEVAEHYQHFGGVSPINQQCRDLLAAVRADFAAHGLDLPVYWGNRNWDPMLADTVTQMRDDEVTRALAFVTSAYGGYSSCRQYQEDIAAARAAVGADAPVIEKLRQFWDHPGFVEPHTDAVRAAVGQLDPAKRDTTRLVFTAHSIPSSMAANAGPHGGRYEAQLRETARLVAAAAAPELEYDLVWQSRSGPRRCLGWNRTSTTTWPPSPRAAPPAWWSARSGSSPITWRSCGTWTPRHWRRPSSSAWTSSGPTPPAPTRVS